MSVEYAKVREQFGKPIGSFQAIQHKCANMLVEVESSKSITYYAAWAVANDVAGGAARRARWRRPTRRTPIGTRPARASRSTAASGSRGSTTCTSSSSVRRAPEVTFGDATWNRELVAQHINL